MKRLSALIIFICLIMSSCQSDNKFSHIKIGVTNTSTALKALPNPKHINQVTHNVTLYIWEDYSLQAENNIITHILRNPNKSEKWVQNWLQRYPYSRVTKNKEKNLNKNLR
ncbi:hypothetical protein N9N67_11065, partial [Bacteriovoracaceae bacterium]|nr:hypothetical protein [Bacteriovoracaceae bacterium]